MEEITGILTGSDCSPFRKLNKDLFEMGLQAEGIVDKWVWMIKSHAPERAGNVQFPAEKCICVIWNPLDCMISLWHMIATGSHNNSMGEDDF